MAASMKGNEMSKQQPTQGNSPASVGHRTSGEAGSTPTHETMAETGGSGGSGLTRNQSGEGSRQSGAATGAQQQRKDETLEPSDSAMSSGARGFQDTRSRQAGGSGTGLGTPETGANQTKADLDRQK
jgi:hypothetical protein